MNNDIPKSVRIIRILEESPTVKTFVMDVEKLDCTSEAVLPGQFVNVWIPDVDEKPMSVAYCDDLELWITVCAVGPFSKAMHELKEGDFVGLRGPYGKGFTWNKNERLVMMAGGYGAAPLYFLTSRAVKDNCLVEFVLGARSEDHLVYRDRLGELENVNLYISTDDGSEGLKGYNTLILDKMIVESRRGNAVSIDCNGYLCVKEEVPVAPISRVYTCGPEMMMKKVSDICFENEIDAQVSIERYMKCGFGICGQCCLDETGEPSCKKGPVFDNVAVRKIKEFGVYHRDSQGKIINF